ncbi:MAG TPA: secondary thiamine-phosphate synthase enzyme YjbQ [Actinomycetota bacterium]|jgi:secondary thiamine-phosphate synthase enzyme|nr:secondary thiamine-phosphate synthase enzyme YjbQ [Actinomycetota bacterium]
MRSVTTTIEVAATARYTYLDLTEELERAIKDSGVTDGAAIVFCAHTTCALLINEWEDGALEDFRNRMIHLVPDDVYYAHDDLVRRTQNLDESHERRNGPAHVKAMVLSASSHAIPVVDGEPMLGRWQRLILFEMDEPKGRQVAFHVFGE